MTGTGPVCNRHAVPLARAPMLNEVNTVLTHPTTIASRRSVSGPALSALWGSPGRTTLTRVAECTRCAADDGRPWTTDRCKVRIQRTEGLRTESFRSHVVLINSR